MYSRFLPDIQNREGKIFFNQMAAKTYLIHNIDGSSINFTVGNKKKVKTEFSDDRYLK